MDKLQECTLKINKGKIIQWLDNIVKHYTTSTDNYHKFLYEYIAKQLYFINAESYLLNHQKA